MNILRLLLGLLVFCSATVRLSAQDTSDCKSIFIKAFNDFRAPPGDAYAISYSTETVLASGETNKEEVEIRFNNLNAFVKSSANKIFKDNEATVVIDDSRKFIFITNVVDRSLTEAKLGQMVLLQDSLLNSNAKFTCQSQVSENGTPSIKISLDSDNKIIASLGLKGIEYWVNESTNQIESISATYAPGHPQLKAMTVHFNEYNKKFSGKAFKGSALSQVYDDDGAVHGAYTKYRVVNNLISQD